jgi:lysophospholipase L1-like esterase
VKYLAAILSLLLLAALSPAPPRVVVIGDSLARGAFATGPQATYAARVAQGLGAPNLLVQPVRDLPEAEAAWGRASVQAWDVVVLEIGINDTISGAVTAEWIADYRALVASMASARVVCVTPFDIGEPSLSADLAARAAAIRSTPGCLIADAHAATLGRPDLRAPVGALTLHNGGVATDDIHPNNAGHALIADTILGAARPRLSLPFIGARP